MYSSLQHVEMLNAHEENDLFWKMNLSYLQFENS